MSKRVYVGNVPFKLTDEELVEAFSACGSVSGVFIIKDKETQRSKGFAFVEMESDASAEKAIAEMNGKLLGGRVLRVSEAVEKRDVRKQ